MLQIFLEFLIKSRWKAIFFLRKAKCRLLYRDHQWGEPEISDLKKPWFDYSGPPLTRHYPYRIVRKVCKCCGKVKEHTNEISDKEERNQWIKTGQLKGDE